VELCQQPACALPAGRADLLGLPNSGNQLSVRQAGDRLGEAPCQVI
jgi:hypothetical protein